MWPINANARSDLWQLINRGGLQIGCLSTTTPLAAVCLLFRNAHIRTAKGGGISTSEKRRQDTGTRWGQNSWGAEGLVWGLAVPADCVRFRRDSAVADNAASRVI